MSGDRRAHHHRPRGSTTETIGWRLLRPMDLPPNGICPGAGGVHGMNVAQEVPLASRSIEDLLQRARAGDEHALDELFEHSREALVRLASQRKYRTQVGGNRPSDVAQEVALRAHKGFKQFRGSS